MELNLRHISNLRRMIIKCKLCGEMKFKGDKTKIKCRFGKKHKWEFHDKLNKGETQTD